MPRAGQVAGNALTRMTATVVLAMVAIGLATMVMAHSRHHANVHDVQFGRVPAVIEHNRGYVEYGRNYMHML